MTNTTNKDRLIRGLMFDSAVNFYAISARELVEGARLMHGASPVCTAALGRSLMAASMLGAMEKIDCSEVSLVIKGGGPAGSIVCVGRPDGSVKGYVTNPAVDLPARTTDGKLDVGRAVGVDGTLTVIRDIGMKEPYIGQSKLVSGEIAEDVASYFATSQQQPSVVYLGVHLNKDGVSSACGLIIQPMPNCPDEAIDKLERRLYTLAEMAGLMEAGDTLERFMDWAFGDMNVVVTGSETPVFSCDCGHERLKAVLLALGKEELLDMADKQKGAELTCHFCKTSYEFSEEELRLLANSDAVGSVEADEQE